MTAALVALGLPVFGAAEAGSQRPQGCGPNPHFRPTSGQEHAASADLGLLARTDRISVTAGGDQANGASGGAAVSASGRFVAFHSSAANLVPDDTTRNWDVFVYDRATGAVERVSVRSDGGESNGASVFPSVSANGRLVAFRSTASNLVPGDTNRRLDAFVYDRSTKTIRRASIGTRGRQANRDVSAADLSGNGRVVIFATAASTLVRGDTNGKRDVFARDLVSNRTTRLSISNLKGQPNDDSNSATVSADGRYVGFRSQASNLVSGDTNGIEDPFVFDRRRNLTRRVNVTSDGEQVFGLSFRPSLSANGRFVAFRSLAANLVPGDTNRQVDVFVRDLAARKTERISVSSSGRQGNGRSYRPNISANGRYVVFASSATTLVRRDTNRVPDVFRHDRRTGRTTRVSLTTGGRQAGGCSIHPKTNADGTVVAFTSAAANLVPADTNRSADLFARILLP
jgi:Tol biopolymer transport system component